MTKRFNVIINNELQPPIDFKVMGLDDIASCFLNWCMENRDNLEWIESHGIMEVRSGNVVLYFNDLKRICRSDKTIVENR